MKEPKINRRLFLKTLGTVAAVSGLPVLASSATSNTPPNTLSRNKVSHTNIKQLGDDFVMVDGWILHKSDLNL